MENISAIGGTATEPLLGGVGGGVLGKDDFLRILVTQLRNQDPINPVDSEKFASELAQFSSLEQLQNINQNLENTLESDFLLNQVIGNTMATTLIGRGVRALGNGVDLSEGRASSISYELGATAKKVTLEIRDASGSVVRTVELEDQLGGNQEYRWDGKDASGNKLGDGVYEVNISAESIDGDAIDVQQFVIGDITGIRYENGSAILMLGNLRVNLGSVLEVGVEGDADADIRTTRTRS